jgi:hypothetical protein
LRRVGLFRFQKHAIMTSLFPRKLVCRSLAAAALSLPLFAHAGAPALHARAAGSPADELLQFDIDEPGVENHFYRRGGVAAHLLASSGSAPRLIVAFPAGNTGMGLWFKADGKPASLGLATGTRVEGLERAGGMRGVRAHLRSDAASLDVGAAVLGNVRTLRDYVTSGGKMLPKEVANHVTRGASLVFRRTSVDGQHHLELQLVPERGTRLVNRNGRSTLVGGAGGQVNVVVTALIDYKPLTPFAMADLLNGTAADRPRDKNALAFLASAENFSAGSWRFLTYFGRDTLLSTQMLMPALQPGAVEAALGSVLERLSPQGVVAHEDAIGEFAVLENRRLPHPPADLQTPIRDYKMVDGDFLLAPVLAGYLLDSPQGRARAKAFLARRTSTGETYDAQIRRNLDLVLQLAAPFALEPKVANLIALRDGVPVGNWRDSNNGLGGGRYAFDINVALVPAALKAAGRLYRSGLLGNAATVEAGASAAARYADAWQDTARFFQVTVPLDAARRQVAAYAAAEGLDGSAAVASITAPVRYEGVALDAGGKPVPVMHSDSGFVLLFSNPAPAYLDAVAAQIVQPFPAGLRTDVGLVVANPAYAPDAVKAMFTRKDYHGTVVWSWQQAMLASGLKRQLSRTDLPAGTRAALGDAQRLLWQGILAMRERSSGELWGWQPKDGKAVLTMWDSAEGDEACAAQLWSTVYLAIKPPAAD